MKAIVTIQRLRCNVTRWCWNYFIAGLGKGIYLPHLAGWRNQSIRPVSISPARSVDFLGEFLQAPSLFARETVDATVADFFQQTVDFGHLFIPGAVCRIALSTVAAEADIVSIGLSGQKLPRIKNQQTEDHQRKHEDHRKHH